jgi:hypothetical protein
MRGRALYPLRKARSGPPIHDNDRGRHDARSFSALALTSSIRTAWPRCPVAKVATIVLVQDNLNIHSKASLYEAFPAAEARRLVERFEWHYMPKHGSWLDLAESELGVLAAQCLDRRIPDKQTLIDEIAAWQRERNTRNTKSDWHFTTKDARIKLKHLYPSI